MAARERKRAGLPHVIVIGGGFAGLECVKRLRRAPVRVTVVDKQNHHLFQPLLYQVATAALSAANIAAPIREILSRIKRVEVVLGEVVDIDPAAARIRLESGVELCGDCIVLGAGLRPVYFGNDHWSALAPPLKTIDDALEIRRRFLLAFETAELEEDSEARRRRLTFVVIGGGPTGVEMAGALAELSRKTIRSEFRRIDTASARIVLIEGQERVLPGFDQESSIRALSDLRQLGVEVQLGVVVKDIDSDGVLIADGTRIESTNVIWAAGVRGSELGAMVCSSVHSDGRVDVATDLTAPGHDSIFVVGDLARIVDSRTGTEVPGVAPAAIQMGRFVGRIIAREARAHRRGRPAPARPRFRYEDKGMLATIGRNRAVAELFGRRFGGRLAYLLWAGVHIYFLIGFRNRILTMLQWMWHYVRYDRSARLITGGLRPRPTRPRSDLTERSRQ